MKKSLLFVLLIVGYNAFAQDGSVSEKSVKGSKVTVCSLEKVQKKETMPLSRLVESCSLVRLQTLSEALFKQWFTTITDKYIGVRQQGNGPYLLFDRSGKFLCSIGSVGKGPGQYAIALYDDFIDEKNNIIYLAPFMGDKILVYNTSGKLLKNIEVPQRLNKPKIFLSNGLLTVVHMAFKGDKAMAFQFDANGNVVKQLAPQANLLVNNFNGEVFNTRNTPAFDFMHTSSDTLYHFNVQRNRIEPVFTMSVRADDKPFRQYIELPHHFITNVRGKGLISTDKDKKTSAYVELVNDYFGNLPIPISVITFRNGWFVYNVETSDLRDKIENHLEGSKVSEKDRQTLKKLLPTLKEENNNVVFIGKLKI